VGQLTALGIIFVWGGNRYEFANLLDAVVNLLDATKWDM